MITNQPQSAQSGNRAAHSPHSPLVQTFLPQLTRAVAQSRQAILDLACGGGRNGLFLDRQGLPLVFADRNNDSLQSLATKMNNNSSVWPVDLETPGHNPLNGKTFAAILVFRYLHRPLFAPIKQAIAPGGLIIYETFTESQAALGRPKNPDFLLKPGELRDEFATWQILDQFEGTSNGSAIARIVAVKNCR